MNKACHAGHPILDGAPVLVGNRNAWAQSGRWMILRRRDLPRRAEALLDAALGVEAPERVRARQLEACLAAYLAEPRPALSPLARAFTDYVGETLDRHAGAARFVLDAGCAAGDPTRLLAPCCETAIGIDLHFERVRAAYERLHGNEAFLVADAADPPFAPRAFEIALWLNLPDATARPREALSHLPALPAPGGLPVLTTPFQYTGAQADPTQWVAEGDSLALLGSDFEIPDDWAEVPRVLPSHARGKYKAG